MIQRTMMKLLLNVLTMCGAPGEAPEPLTKEEWETLFWILLCVFIAVGFLMRIITGDKNIYYEAQ